MFVRHWAIVVDGIYIRSIVGRTWIRAGFDYANLFPFWSQVERETGRVSCVAVMFLEVVEALWDVDSGAYYVAVRAVTGTWLAGERVEGNVFCRILFSGGPSNECSQRGSPAIVSGRQEVAVVARCP